MAQAPSNAFAGSATGQTQPAGGGAADAAEAGPVAPKGKLIVIDPGHGGSDPGAVHKAANGETDIKEEDATLAVAQKLADMLRADGYDVSLTRTEDANVAPGGAKVADLQARVDTANKNEADLLVSVHFNGLQNHDTRGTEVWYCGDRPFAGENMKLATAVQEALVRNLNQAGYETAARGIKDDAKMGHFAINGPHIARPSNMPGLIGEALFMTNDQDAAQLQRPEIQDTLARGYFEGIKGYFGDA